MIYQTNTPDQLTYQNWGGHTGFSAHRLPQSEIPTESARASFLNHIGFFFTKIDIRGMAIENGDLAEDSGEDVSLAYYLQLRELRKEEKQRHRQAHSLADRIGRIAKEHLQLTRKNLQEDLERIRANYRDHSDDHVWINLRLQPFPKPLTQPTQLRPVALGSKVVGADVIQLPEPNMAALQSTPEAHDAAILQFPPRQPEFQPAA